MTTMLLDTPDINDILAHPVQLANMEHAGIDAATIEHVEGYDDIRRRFEAGFEAFVQQKKHKAVTEVLKHELGQNPLATSENLIAAVMDCLEDEALIETPYVFVALNPQMMI